MSDDGVGFPARPEEGTGLGVLRQRIRTLYGEASELRVESEPGGTRVVLELPAEASAGAASGDASEFAAPAQAAETDRPE